MSRTTMESLSELQNPLLDKSNRHVVQGYRGDYPTQRYHEDSLVSYYYSGTNDDHKSQQFLDATSLHLAVEAFYKPNLILCKDNVSLHSKDSKSEIFETTFTESKDAVLGEDSAENQSTQGEKDVKIQTVSYDVEDEQVPEYETLVNDILRDMLDQFVVVYLDDILIFARNLQEHQHHLCLVLQRLLENRLFVKAEKCHFHAS
ncbi:synapse differentiation-inducing gene protein 1-like isoform X2 [Nerophis ophidion]|uniref:synapse differentiation-inducing gene protein 1-like isoform X2 n=1 Tax=Nerophis ophidion TaxID=159077 RepID=UPI002AE05E7B|nr:synapse differentiation-inducing gene protein 1-like isoform X2 [Nerophis ophidion]